MMFGGRNARAVAGVVVVMSALTGPLHGEDCPEIASNPERGFHVGVNVALGNGLAFVLTRDIGYGYGTLRVFDVSEHGPQSRLAEIAWYGNDIAASGAYAYSANSGQGLWVIDATIPERPVATGPVPAPGYAHAIALAIDGDHLFVASGHAGLRVYDISDRSSPVEVGYLEDGSSYRRVAVFGDHAYAIARTSDERFQLRVIDVSRPWAPLSVASLDVDFAYVPAVEANEDHVFLAGAYAGESVATLEVVNVRNPRSPRVISRSDLGRSNRGTWLSMTKVGPRLYIAQSKWAHYPGQGTLWVVDVHRPRNPVVSGEYDEVDGVPTDPVGLAYSEGLLYLAGWDGPDGLMVLDFAECYLHDHGAPDRDPDDVPAGE